MLSNADGAAAPLKIGPHTIMRGDCLERLREIPDGSVDLILTDPPYGTMAGAGLNGWGGEKTDWDVALEPVALLTDLIETYSNAGDTVLDFTMGSGTTGVACARTGRNFIGIELDPTYYLASAMRIAAEVGL